jgi:hypothetical protein
MSLRSLVSTGTVIPNRVYCGVGSLDGLSGSSSSVESRSDRTVSTHLTTASATSWFTLLSATSSGDAILLTLAGTKCAVKSAFHSRVAQHREISYSPQI